MEYIKLGILRETKIPSDRRVAVPPAPAREIMERYPRIKIIVQPSPIRCYLDKEYLAEGIELNEDLSECDLLIGIKEVKIHSLIKGKKYLFFAHVAKKQEYNKQMLKAILDQGITLIDYEYLTSPEGTRLISFGHWAGVMGAYNGLRAWGTKTDRFSLPPANWFQDRNDIRPYITGLNLGLVRILVTGGGRVAKGALETLDAVDIPKTSPDDYIKYPERSPIYCCIGPQDYIAAENGGPFDFEQFCKNPRGYVSIFHRFYSSTDLLITAHFWDPASPRLWESKEMQKPDFRIRVIADISCDINGSVPSTIRSTSIEEPFYDFDRFRMIELRPFSGPDTITVMAIDNLPGEFPRKPSEEFAKVLMDKIIPCILNDDPLQILERATIARDGHITPRFQYLENWISR